MTPPLMPKVRSSLPLGLGANFATLLVLRGIALGGRFLFVIFAVKYMQPADFGRFGLLAAIAQIVPVLVGLEAHQIFLRRILQDPVNAPANRRLYAAFAVAGAFVSGMIGALVLAAFGWSLAEVLLGGAILALEQIGLETFRNLINERKPALSVLSVALRTGAWGIAVPALFFAGLVSEPWTFEIIQLFWIAGSAGALLAGIPIWRLFRPNRANFDPRRNLGPLREVLRRSWMWIVYTASWRVIETGGRFLCAWIISEAASGRFTFLAMLASIGYVAQKGVVEPIYYPRLAVFEATESTFRQFARVNLVVIMAGTVCSVAGLGVSSWLNGTLPPVSELIGFAILCLAFALLTLSQAPHYRLFRQHRDRAIMLSGIVGSMSAAVFSVAATWCWGVPGACAGTAIGAGLLLVFKARASKRLMIAGVGTEVDRPGRVVSGPPSR